MGRVLSLAERPLHRRPWLACKDGFEERRHPWHHLLKASGHRMIGILNHEQMGFARHLIVPIVVVIYHEKLVPAGVDHEFRDGGIPLQVGRGVPWQSN